MRAPLLLIVALTGCSQMAIDGQVTQVNGAPLEGAVVTAIGTQCRDTTDAEGRFELVCLPGTYDISIGAMSYISETIEAFEATERQRYDLGKRPLIRIPEEKGLLLFDGERYTPMRPGRLERRVGGSGMSAYKHYCLPPKGTEVNTLRAGPQGFFDNESEGWRPWRLDAEGCAVRMSPETPTQWGFTYKEKAEFQTRAVAQDKKLVLMNLEPGRYFIADWRKGFFTKADDDEGGYTGFYLEVVE
ncbi:MAG: carboxypeptidase regulatory-like domain-containing protein [Alphaproteobacteria bacterium]|nr:carboxypeptidase regulatory-like domain-containing protein [Alphaproteobacteria bacterium]